MVVGKECARCQLNNEKHEQHEKAKSSYYSCSGCKKKKSLLDFSPTTIKNFLQARKKKFGMAVCDALLAHIQLVLFPNVDSDHCMQQWGRLAGSMANIIVANVVIHHVQDVAKNEK